MGKFTNSFWIGLSIIWVSHLLMDFMIGVWTIYKTLAGINLVIAGSIAGVGIFIGEGLQLYFGYLSDRGYQQRLLALGIGLTATIPFLSYFKSEWVLMAMVLCAYIGSGAFHPSGSSLVLVENSSHKSSLIALFACGGMIGAASSQIAYTYLYHQFGGNLWFLSIPILFCAASCAFFAFPKGEQNSQQVKFGQVLKALNPQRYKIILLYIVHVLLQIVVLSFTFLLPEILLIKGYEAWFCLGGGYFYFILGSALTTVPLGYCVDKVGYRLVLGAIVVASTAFLYLFLQIEASSLAIPILLLVFLGGAMGAIIPVVVAGGIQNVPAYTRSFVCALYMGGTTCIAGLGPLFTSLFASFFEERAPLIAMQGLLILLMFSLGLIYYLPDPLSVSQESQSINMASSLNGEI